MSSDDSPTPVMVVIDPVGANKLLDSVYDFLDVRTVEEFNEVHVATEKIANIPYMFDSPNGRVKNDRFLEEVSAVFKKDDPLIVGGQTGGRGDSSEWRGGRSECAYLDLQINGFHYVLLLGGGIEAWLDEGLPVVRPTE